MFEAPSAKEVRAGRMICPSCRIGIGPAVRTCPACGALVPVGPGAVIAGRFELLARLGAGGMGAVFKALDRRLHETVAVKVLPLGRDVLALARFHSEVRLARKVKHRNVCAVYEYGEDGDVVFCAMELVSGRDLRELLDEAPLPHARAYEIGLAVAAGLQAIHEAGVIHRDVKPANVMIDAGDEIRLVDFGIAKSQRPRGDEAAARGLTEEHHVVGSPEYMSPEQVRGRSLDPRSDIYSFGVVLYEMFSGRVPFQAETAAGVMAKHVEEDPPLEGPVADLIPPELVPVLRRCLAKEPRERYASVGELRRDLVAAQEASARARTDEVAVGGDGVNVPAQAVRADGAFPVRQGRIRQRLPIAAAAVLAALAVAIAAYLARGRPTAEGPERARPMRETGTSVRSIPPSSPTPGAPTLAAASSLPTITPPRAHQTPRPTAGRKAGGAAIRPTPTPSLTPTPTPAPSLTPPPLPSPTPTPPRALAPTPAQLTAPVAPVVLAPVLPKRGDMLSASDPEATPASCVSCDVAYSPQAERLRVEGDVVIGLVVDEDGRVTEARVVRSDDKLLEAPALRSVTKWRYRPAEKHGVAGKMRLEVTVKFRLQR